MSWVITGNSYYHTAGVRKTCHDVKQNENQMLRNEAIKKIAEDLISRCIVQPGDVLIPAPQHNGNAEYTKDIAKMVSEKVLSENARGILICGTGIGMSIAANRFRGIRASHCTDTYSARMTRMHNNSNVLCLGERITGSGLAKDIVDIWLNTEFEGGRHQKRIDMI